MHIHIKAWTGDVGVLLTGQTVSPFFVFFWTRDKTAPVCLGPIDTSSFLFLYFYLDSGHPNNTAPVCLGPLFLYCLGSCWSAAPTIKTKQNKMSTLIHPPIYKCPHTQFGSQTHSSVPAVHVPPPSRVRMSVWGHFLLQRHVQ